jgi:hypothetical protein
MANFTSLMNYLTFVHVHAFSKNGQLLEVNATELEREARALYCEVSLLCSERAKRRS